MNIAKAAVSVRISKLADASFAQLMNWLRIWLDMRRYSQPGSDPSTI